MTTLSSTDYFAIRKELREKYFMNNDFTQLTDVLAFQRCLMVSANRHIGELSESYFIINYIVIPEQKETLQTKAPYNDLKKLKLILSNPNQYLNPKNNIQAVYNYLQELNQYNPSESFNYRVAHILTVFDKHGRALSISTKPNNNQQLWI